MTPLRFKNLQATQDKAKELENNEGQKGFALPETNSNFDELLIEHTSSENV